jgi:hypothetical protein
MDFTLLTTQETFGVVAVVLGVIGYLFYIRGIVQGKVKPHVFTWFVWGVLTSIAFFAQFVSGGGAGAWVTGLTALASFGFALVGLRSDSRMLIAKSDWIFFVGALCAIPVWYLSGDPLWSVIIITVIDAVAFAPTFRKAYFYPDTENAATYALSGIKFIFGLLALQSFNLVTALYPLSLVLANLLFVGMLMSRRRWLVSHK